MTAASAIPPPSESAGAAAPLLQVRAIAKHFGALEVLKAISLDIASGEFITLLGESGSGKTTMLRLIAGFEQPTSGEIWMNGERLDTLPPYKRRVNTVFQQYALFPHLNVRDNVAYGLRVTNAPAAEIDTRVARRSPHGQDGHLRRRSPPNPKRRPATAHRSRTRASQSPAASASRRAALRARRQLRKQMQSELKSLQREVGITFLFVTHDQEEAMALSDRIALLRNGALEQIASPREIYSRPATAYTAQFIGQTNLLRANVHQGMAKCGPLLWIAGPGLAGAALFSLRPEAIQLAGADKFSPSEVRFSATIQQQLYAGSSELLEVDCGDGQLLRVKIPARGPLSGTQDFSFSADDAVRVAE